MYKIVIKIKLNITDTIDNETQGEKNQGSFGDVESNSFASHGIS